MSKPESKKSPEEQSAEDFAEAINQQSSESLKVKLLALYKNQNQRDDILEQGYNESFYAIEYGYHIKYNEINKEISSVINQGVRIPEYWRKVIENSKFFTVNDKDKEILKHLIDIEIKHDEADKKSFIVYFIFESNSFFDETVLEKQYIFNKKEDAYLEAKSKEINWKGSPPNIKMVKKKIKKGKTSSTITKEKKVDSFFNIFEAKQDDDEDEDNEEKEDDENDISSEAEFVLNDLVPFSMEYYLDIQKLSALDDQIDEDEDEDDEDDNAKGSKKKHK